MQRVLIIDNDRSQAEMLQQALSLEGFETNVETSSVRALERLRRERFDVVLSDLRMPELDGFQLYQKVKRFRPRQTYIIMTAYGNIENAVDAVKSGVFDFIQKPIHYKELITILHRAKEFRSMKDEVLELRRKVRQKYDKDTIIGNSAAMKELMEQVEMAANSEATLLIEGESGTGKELIAHHIHYQSPRCEGPFIKVNCGALPETLLEDELFGHVKGAFTGAVSGREGRFERANGGSILLDEISEMPQQLQVKLLRVLQEREFERLGATETIPVDVRVIVATNRRLSDLVDSGKFRADLFYRINVIPLELPPLRERRDDILLLARHFLSRSSSKNNRMIRRITPEAERLLMDYDWPGNVRELENCIERATVMCRGEEIGVGDLSFVQSPERHTDRKDVLDHFLVEKVSLEALERDYIQRGLELAKGNQSRAAKLLGVSRRTLQYRAEKHGLLKADRAGKPSRDGEDSV